MGELLGVTQQAIAKRLKAMGTIQKQGNWVPYELKPRDVERRFFACKQLKNGSTTIIPWAENHEECSGIPARRQPDRIFTLPRLCSVFGGTSSVWCSNRIDQTQLMRLSRELKETTKPQYQERYYEVILQHDNARPHVARAVKTYLETLKWEVSSHPPYSPDVAPSDYHLFRSMTKGRAHQHSRSNEEVKKWIDSWIASKDALFFWDGSRQLPERWKAKLYT